MRSRRLREGGEGAQVDACDEGEEQQGCSVPLHARVEFGAVFHEDVAAEHPVQRGVLVDEAYAVGEGSVS